MVTPKPKSYRILKMDREFIAKVVVEAMLNEEYEALKEELRKLVEKLYAVCYKPFLATMDKLPKGAFSMDSGFTVTVGGDKKLQHVCLPYNFDTYVRPRDFRVFQCAVPLPKSYAAQVARAKELWDKIYAQGKKRRQKEREIMSLLEANRVTSTNRLEETWPEVVPLFKKTHIYGNMLPKVKDESRLSVTEQRQRDEQARLTSLQKVKQEATEIVKKHLQKAGSKKS